MGDPREEDSCIIYHYGSLAGCYKRARQLILHWNKERFHPRKRAEIKNMTDTEFVDMYDNAWLRAPNILELPKEGV